MDTKRSEPIQAEAYFTDVIRRASLAGNEERITESQAEFFMTCLSENLAHARHVEMERLTFMSIYMAVVAGALAFVYGIGNGVIRIGMTALLIVIGVITLLLTKRWRDAFNEYKEEARTCYHLWFGGLFPAEVQGRSPDSGEKLPHYLYAFDVKRPSMVGGFRIRTDRVIRAFNLVILALLIVSLIYFIFCL